MNAFRLLQITLKGLIAINTITFDSLTTVLSVILNLVVVYIVVDVVFVKYKQVPVNHIDFYINPKRMGENVYDKLIHKYRFHQSQLAHLQKQVFLHYQGVRSYWLYDHSDKQF